MHSSVAAVVVRSQNPAALPGETRLEHPFPGLNGAVDRRQGLPLARWPQRGSWFVTRCLGALAALMLGSAASAATVTGFTPDRGGPGTEITVLGTGLQNVLFVYFGSTEATGEILSRSAASVRARVPPNALTGQISVFINGGGFATSLQVFVTTPRIESFTPLAGAPGSLITLDGVNFGTGQFGSRGNVTSVLFNGQPALFEISAINQLLTLVPTNATTGPITLANEAGSTSSLIPFHVAPLISSVTPTNGMPGDAIEIQGANIGTALRVEFGLEPAPFAVVSPSILVARVPTNAVNARLQITTPAGTIATATPFVVRPRIFGFAPNAGTTGTNVLLEGGGFHGVTEVDFNGTRATFTYRSSTQVSATVPVNATTGPIRVVTTNGTFTSTDLFHLPARITSFNPSSGKRGDLITVDGQNLSGTTRVLFNNAAAEFNVLSPTRLTATLPANATSGRVSVETPAGTVLSSGTFNVTPVLDGFTPANASVGSPITLSGAGLTNIVWIRLGGLDMSFTLLGPTQIRAIVPLNAFSGPIRLRTLNGIETEAPGTFFVDGARPTISAFAPAEGAAGTSVRIEGQGLLTASRVQFNGVDAVLGTRTATSVQTTVPANATTGAIAVTTLDGIAISSTPFTLREPAVILGIERGSTSQEAVLRWNASAVGYVLQSAPSPTPGITWTNVPGNPVTDGTTLRLTVPIPTGGASYYRLRK